jgi:hypothetical protein
LEGESGLAVGEGVKGLDDDLVESGVEGSVLADALIHHLFFYLESHVVNGLLDLALHEREG